MNTNNIKIGEKLCYVEERFDGARVRECKYVGEINSDHIDPILNNRDRIIKIGDTFEIVNLENLFMDKVEALTAALALTISNNQVLIAHSKDFEETTNKKLSDLEIRMTKNSKRLTNIRTWAAKLPIFKFNSNKNYGEDA